MKARERFSVEERAERFQRRYTEPWERRIEFVRLGIAMRDLERVVIEALYIPRIFRWWERRSR